MDSGDQKTPQHTPPRTPLSVRLNNEFDSKSHSSPLPPPRRVGIPGATIWRLSTRVANSLNPQQLTIFAYHASNPVIQMQGTRVFSAQSAQSSGALEFQVIVPGNSTRLHMPYFALAQLNTNNTYQAMEPVGGGTYYPTMEAAIKAAQTFLTNISKAAVPQHVFLAPPAPLSRHVAGSPFSSPKPPATANSSPPFAMGSSSSNLALAHSPIQSSPHPLQALAPQHASSYQSVVVSVADQWFDDAARDAYCKRIVKCLCNEPARLVQTSGSSSSSSSNSKPSFSLQCGKIQQAPGRCTFQQPLEPLSEPRHPATKLLLRCNCGQQQSVPHESYSNYAGRDYYVHDRCNFLVFADSLDELYRNYDFPNVMDASLLAMSPDRRPASNHSHSHSHSYSSSKSSPASYIA